MTGAAPSPPAETSGEALPEGIVAVPVTHYRVGSYLYTSLADARAEHARRNGDKKADNK